MSFVFVYCNVCSCCGHQYVFTNTYVLYCMFTIRQYVLRVLYITLLIVSVLFCVPRLSHVYIYIYVCTLYITNVCTYCTFCKDLCFTCMYILCHSGLYKVLYLCGLVVIIMYVYGACISCLRVTHLGVPTILL